MEPVTELLLAVELIVKVETLETLPPIKALLEPAVMVSE